MSKTLIENGQAILGIELGSTRIKAILIDNNHNTIASGSFEWENQFINNIWSYSLDNIWNGIQNAYQEMASSIYKVHGIHIEKLKSIGISAMMHGYMAFDKNEQLLVPFRTWRNSITSEASEKLTKLFNYNIPQRWSIAHLYQSILNKEPHVTKIDFLTTLSGYIHWQLTGNKVLGIGDASGMFPINIKKGLFSEKKITAFNQIINNQNFSWELGHILPTVLPSGKHAGTLSHEGSAKLDTSGYLQYGIPMCPPEGDAGTGMVATNSVAERTGNISAGTSIFAMIVLEKELKKIHPEIDMVTTPSGALVAMVHANNCTSDLNAWVGIFSEFAREIGCAVNKESLFQLLYKSALNGDADCGGLMSYGFFSGENILSINEGRPVFTRLPNSNFTLSNFMRTHLFSSLATTKIGLDILTEDEQVKLDKITGHGGIFKTKGVAQKIMATALNTSVCVMDTAGEGGAWGIAILASYMMNKKENETLTDFLSEHVFNQEKTSIIYPEMQDLIGFSTFITRFKACLAIEKAAISTLK